MLKWLDQKTNTFTVFLQHGNKVNNERCFRWCKDELYILYACKTPRCASQHGDWTPKVPIVLCQMLKKIVRFIVIFHLVSDCSVIFFRIFQKIRWGKMLKTKSELENHSSLYSTVQYILYLDKFKYGYLYFPHFCLNSWLCCTAYTSLFCEHLREKYVICKTKKFCDTA